LNNPVAVSRWAAAALAIPYTEEVGQNIVDALFQIAFMDFLQPHIPIEIWRLLKRRPFLPPNCCGIWWAGHVSTVAYVRRLRDVDILKSLFLLVWADRCNLLPEEVREMQRSIRVDFAGIGMEHHRKDLMERLDDVLGQLNSYTETSFEQEVKTNYTELRNVLLEVDRQ
jgi:hypothetical protein